MLALVFSGRSLNRGEPDMSYEQETQDAFDEFLDESVGEIVILGMKFQASQVLKEVDPIAYRELVLNWQDGE
jgi:hypothetical protein